METVEGGEKERRIDTRDFGIRWYHVGFALAFGLGTAILPPKGATTIAGWVGGALGSFVASFLLVGLGLLGVRSLDNWRPPTEPRADVPTSRYVYAIFVLICLQLFIFGTEISVDLGPTATLVLLAPFNPLISGAVLGDMLRLRRQGVEWETVDFGYAAVALLVGFAGGLGYWYRRGRKRTEWYEQHQAASETASATEADAGEDEEDTADVTDEDPADT